MIQDNIIFINIIRGWNKNESIIKKNSLDVNSLRNF